MELYQDPVRDGWSPLSDPSRDGWAAHRLLSGMDGALIGDGWSSCRILMQFENGWSLKKIRLGIDGAPMGS
eukprot:7925793-Pyramimonas_sp.AAC.1